MPLTTLLTTDLAMQDLLKILAGLVVMLGALWLYLLPAYIAYRRRHHQAAPILVLNLVFGWTLLGWVGTLAWAVSAVRSS
jgi:T4 superinfection immunity protein